MADADDDLLAAFSGQPKTVSATDDDLLSSFSGSAFTGYSPVKSEAKTKAQSFVPGMRQGLIDVAGNIPVDAVQNYTKAQTAQFDKDYAGDNLASIGRVTGNIMGTVPIMAVGGAGLAAGGRALATAAPRLAPAIDFLGGTSQAGKIAGGGALTTGEKLLSAGSKFTAGAEGGAAANVLATGTSEESIPQRALEGAEIGGPLAMVPGAARATKNLLTGGGPNPDRVALAKKAVEEFGIPVRGPQISSSPIIKGADETLKNLPFTGYAGRDEKAREAFTKAVGSTFGADTSSLTPKVMAESKARIGAMFDTVADNTAIKVDTILPKLSKIETETSVMGDDVFKPIQRQLEHVTSVLSRSGKAEVPGSVYKELTKTGSQLDKAIHGKNEEIADAALQIKYALNEALMENAPQHLKDMAEQANGQYKAYMTVRPLMVKEGVDAAVNPAMLATRVNRAYPDFVEGGGGKLGDLARIGNEFFSKEASSTGHPVWGGLAQVAGASGLGHLAGANPITAAAIAGGSLAAAPIASGALNSNIYRNRLLKYGAPPSAPNPFVQAIKPSIAPAATITLNSLNNGSFGLQ